MCRVGRWRRLFVAFPSSTFWMLNHLNVLPIFKTDENKISFHLAFSTLPCYGILYTHLKWLHDTPCKCPGRDHGRVSHHSSGGPGLSGLLTFSHPCPISPQSCPRRACGPWLGLWTRRAGFQQSWCHPVGTKPDGKKDGGVEEDLRRPRAWMNSVPYSNRRVLGMDDF